MPIHPHVCSGSVVCVLLTLRPQQHLRRIDMRSLLVGLLFSAGVSTVHALPISGQGTWETTLQARDVNHDGVVDAYYDTALKVTWLADANLALTSGYDTHSPPFALGAMTWNDANVWAQSLDVFGVTGWRLPEAVM